MGHNVRQGIVHLVATQLAFVANETMLVEVTSHPRQESSV